MSRSIEVNEEMFEANNSSLGEQGKMSRITKEYEELVDGNNNSIGECLKNMYFKTELDTEVMIDCGLYTIIFTPEEEDFFTQETLDAICRVLKDNDYPFSEEDGRVFVNVYEGNFEEIVNNIIQQVDEKLDVILEEKGIDPNAKNDHFLSLYSDNDDDEWYDDIRIMYERELPYDESEYTEPVGNIDDDGFIESLEVEDNTENKKTKKTVKNWFGFIK